MKRTLHDLDSEIARLLPAEERRQLEKIMRVENSIDALTRSQKRVRALKIADH